MTKEEKIIATAFTGKMFIDGSEMGSLYEYMEKKVGHGVIDLMLASKEFREELHKACEQDFIDMVSKEQPSLPSNLDEAAEFDKMFEDFCDQHPDGLTLNECAEFFYDKGKQVGAEWMAGQGETIECSIDWYDGPFFDFSEEQLYSAIVKAELEVGDKVIVQIRKK